MWAGAPEYAEGPRKDWPEEEWPRKDWEGSRKDCVGSRKDWADSRKDSGEPRKDWLGSRKDCADSRKDWADCASSRKECELGRRCISEEEGGEVPVSAPLVDDAVVVTFVACSSPRTATKRLVVVLLLDGDVLLLRRMLRVAVALAGPGGRLGGCGHGGMERGEVAHHLLVLVELVGVDGLRVLAQVVEARELLAAVAGERALASVFSGWMLAQEPLDIKVCGPDVPCQVLASGEDHSAFAVAPALEGLCGGRTIALVDAALEEGLGVGDESHVVV